MDPEEPTAAILNGRYRVDRLLARGGMAEVYVGEDLVLLRTVALKVLAQDLSRDEGFVERFRREAQAAAGLNHPHIVAVYDWGESDGSFFIVMEYVAGETLAHLVGTEGPLPVERTVAIGADIADALSAAHRQGVVHRDVKPGNVLLDLLGGVKVTDFGIARAAQVSDETPLTQTGAVLGTAAYLSPEQAEGRSADARSDLYALGVVLYEMATGTPPFKGDSPVSVAYQHVRVQPESPRTLNPAVPVWLETIILRALAKDPDRRYAGAEELRADLLASGDGRSSTSTLPLPVLARPVGPAPWDERLPAWAAPWRWSRRSLLVAMAVLMAAAIAIGASILPGDTSPVGGHARGTGKPPTGSDTTATSSRPTASLATTFAGFTIVSGSGPGALYCPTGVVLGSPGAAGPAGNGPPGTVGGTGGAGGTAGCSSNGGSGGRGGNAAPGGGGGAGGNGGSGGCPPSTLGQMRARYHPCNGSGSDGGDGGNGGNGAPGEIGGSGGVGGNGGNTQMAKGGNGGNGGNATPMSAGAPGGAGEPGGGQTGTTAGVVGQNGTNGSNGAKAGKP